MTMEIDKYEVRNNSCNCHPETCGCRDYVILKNGEKYVGVFDEQKATHITKCLNEHERLK